MGRKPLARRVRTAFIREQHTLRKINMTTRPPFIVSAADVPERSHVYPQSDEPMGPMRRIGDAAGLKRVGINLQRLPPGSRSSWPHAESDEEEFVYVIEGTVDAWIDGRIHPMAAGDLAAFPAGTGICHCFINNGEREALLLVGGEAESDKLAKIAAALPPGRVEVASGLPLAKLAERLSSCAGFVGHDSGITHLAAALGLRTLALWPDTPETVWRPRGDHVALLRHPRWGYGRHMNPCIDCRHFMFRIGAACLEEFGAQFLFTGEVLGQRPMSQTRNVMELIDRAAGVAGWIVRPLSGALLDVTEPERRGWIDRARMFSIAGRGRNLQLELAQRWNLTRHQSPGGGCLLTDVHFSNRVRDLFDHTAGGEATVDDLALLKLGRHVRVRPDLKIVLGRDHDENRALARFENDGRWCVEPVGASAPTALVCGSRDEPNLEAAIGLIVAHARRAPDGVQVRWRDAQGRERSR